MAGKPGMHKKAIHPIRAEEVRARIQASQIINRLTNHCLGEIEMTASQVTAGLGLLRKCVPDLTAVEHSGEIKHNYVAEIPAPAENVDAWKQSLYGGHNPAPRLDS